MNALLFALDLWFRELLTDGILANLSGVFGDVNEKVAAISGEVAKSPQSWNPSVFSLIRTLSEQVVLPIAAALLAVVMTLDLIRMVTERNSMHELDFFQFFKWIFKTACAVLILTHTWDLVFGIFEAGSSACASAYRIVAGNTAVDVAAAESALQNTLASMTTGELFGLWFESLFLGLTLTGISLCIFLITYARMIEIYLVTSVAPLPLSLLFAPQEVASGAGTGYLRSLFALAFQGFLMLVCVGIYAVLIRTIPSSSDPAGAIRTVMGYSLLLCIGLFETGNLSKSLFAARA